MISTFFQHYDVPRGKIRHYFSQYYSVRVLDIVKWMQNPVAFTDQVRDDFRGGTDSRGHGQTWTRFNVSVEPSCGRCCVWKYVIDARTHTHAHTLKIALGHCYLTPSHPPTRMQQQSSQPLDTVPFSPHSRRRI